MESQEPAGPRRLTPRKRLLFIAVVVLAPLLVLELACRVGYRRIVPEHLERYYAKLLERDLGTGFAQAYRPHPYTCFEPDPAYEDSMGRWHTDDGFRFPEMSRARRPGVYRIACMGGSTTYEPYVPVDSTYVAYLEEYLNRRFPGRPIEVLNAGVGAYNSADTFARFHFKVLDYAPDMVVNYDGINDVWPMLCKGPFESDLRHARKVMEPFEPPSRLASALARRSFAFRVLYFKLRLGGTVPSIMDLTYEPFDMTVATYEAASTRAFRRNLEDTAFICKGRGIELVLCTFAADEFQTGRDPARDPYALLMRGVDDLNKVTASVARELSLPLIDLDRAMPRNEPAAKEAHRYFTDICHTSRRGNRAKANLIGQGIVPILEKKLGVAAVPFEHDVTANDSGSYPAARLDR